MCEADFLSILFKSEDVIMYIDIAVWCQTLVSRADILRPIKMESSHIGTPRYV